jgi:CheY-like chemotaxis protein
VHDERFAVRRVSLHGLSNATRRRARVPTRPEAEPSDAETRLTAQLLLRGTTRGALDATNRERSSARFWRGQFGVCATNDNGAIDEEACDLPPENWPTSDVSPLIKEDHPGRRADARDAILKVELVEVLADAGYGVDQATNGVVALSAMRSARPWIVLLDMMLAVMSGWDVLREMQQDPALAGIPVCVVSAQGQSTPNVSCILPKPVNVDAVLAVVRSRCETTP